MIKSMRVFAFIGVFLTAMLLSTMMAFAESEDTEFDPNSDYFEDAGYSGDAGYDEDSGYDEDGSYYEDDSYYYDDGGYYEDDGYYGSTEEASGNASEDYARGKVLSVLNENQDDTEYSGGVLESNYQLLEVLVTSGPHKGEKVQARYELNLGYDDRYQSKRLAKGDEILLYLDVDENGQVVQGVVVEFIRDKYLLYLVIVFMVLLLVIGRLKGLKAIVSLVITALSIVYILIPAILKGWDPVRTSVFVCICVISVTMVIIGGFNRKTLSAIIGTAGGVLSAGVIALVIGSLAKLTGLGDDESQMLMLVQDVHFDFSGLLFAGILIGTMGATMDVGMSIASAMHEIKVNSPNIKTSALIKAGMNVGKDTMATMANTLILAYVGGSLHLLLMLMAYNTPFNSIINWDMIASEILKALAGSIGVIVTIPITTLTAVFIEEYKKKERNDKGGFMYY